MKRSAKLTEEERQTIKDMYDNGVKIFHIAVKMKVCCSTVYFTLAKKGIFLTRRHDGVKRRPYERTSRTKSYKKIETPKTKNYADYFKEAREKNPGLYPPLLQSQNKF